MTEKTYQLTTNTLGIKNLDSVIQHRSNGFEIFDGLKHINRAKAKEFTYYAYRRKFDHLLFESVMKSGCSILTRTSIEDQSNNKIKIKGKWYKYNYLLGADGVHSSVRRRIKMARPNKNMAFGLQVDIPLNSWRPATDWKIPKIFFGYVKYGWGWIFPKGDHLSVGLAGLFDQPKMVRDAFQNFLKDLSCFEHSKHNQVRGSAIPYGSYINNPCKKNVLLLGDAAGFVDPITGEGIYFAMLSGHCAALSILENDNVQSKYRERCQTEIIKPLRQALFIRRFLFEEPFRSYAMRRFKKDTKYMELFMKVLSGTIDYNGYLIDFIKKN